MAQQANGGVILKRLQRKVRITSVNIEIWHFHLESFILEGVKESHGKDWELEEDKWSLQMFAHSSGCRRRRGREGTVEENKPTSAKPI